MNRFIKTLTAGTAIAGGSYAAYAATTWLRYGRSNHAPHDAADALLDSFMANPEVCERHAIDIAAPPDVTFAAAKAADLSGSRIIRAIFDARALIMRSKPAVTDQPTGFVDSLRSLGWGVLAETDRELVFGAVTKPWQANPVFRAIPAEQFAAFAEPDYVKIAWTLRVDTAPDGSSIFRTETRASATDERARTKFRVYWSLLSPGIILIRIAMLPAIKAAAEKAWRLEGDDILPDVPTQLTHAMTIDAPASDVWPWLLQMGCRRGGWYSWDRLDNGGVRSADRIRPELQTLKVGDVLPATPRTDEGFEVLRIVAGRALVLGGLSPQWKGTWRSYSSRSEPNGHGSSLAIAPRTRRTRACH